MNNMFASLQNALDNQETEITNNQPVWTAPKGVPMGLPANTSDTMTYEPFIPNSEGNYEYVNTTLPDGESVRFKRVWGGHRFTDDEVNALTNGFEISITTKNRIGIIGGLDFQEYEGTEFYGFAPNAESSYTLLNAPVPIQFMGHFFTEEEYNVLRSGEKALIICQSGRTGNSFGLHVSFGYDAERDMWCITPHFDEFEKDAYTMQRDDCLFTPMFGERIFTQKEITYLRKGKGLYHEGLNRRGKEYTCRLFLEFTPDSDRWRVVPTFDR